MMNRYKENEPNKQNNINSNIYEESNKYIINKKDKSYIFVNILKLSIILFIILIIYNIFLVIYSEKTNKEAKFFLGFRAYVITTDSMRPRYKYR